jgi:uncharacterized protein (TIGR03435 family)
VASVKPAAPDDGALPIKGKMQDMMQEMQNDRNPGFIPRNSAHVTLRNRSLQSLIATAYRVKLSQVNGPSWISESRFDIEAKMPEDAPLAAANERLQVLLEERFALKTHRENKTTGGYALLVSKNGAKLKVADTADPDSKPLSKEEMQAQSLARLNKMVKDMKAAGGGAGPSYRGFKRASAEALAQGVAQLIHSPVVDMTELTGLYDIDLEIPPPEDSADSIESRVARALEKLGLKLESRKVTVDTIVVDSASKTPAAN